MLPASALNYAGKIPEPTMRAGLIAGFVTIILFTTGVVVAETSMSEQNVLKGREAFGGWQKDRPGVRRLLKGVRRLLKPEDQPPIGNLNMGRDRKEV
jgi:hypothetical protein